MNRLVLLCLVATGLLVAAGCVPRHPPHTPQPVGWMSATDDLVFVKER
jgi:hypothetical protein